MLASNDAGDPSFMYYLNDGIYGTFNFLAFNDHYSVTPLVLKVILNAIPSDSMIVEPVWLDTERPLFLPIVIWVTSEVGKYPFFP